MTRLAGIVVVNRMEMLRWAAEVDPEARAAPVLGLTGQQLFERYRGFDGVPWPESEGLAGPGLSIVDGMAELAQLAAVEKYVGRLASPDETDTIMIAKPGARTDEVLDLGWRAVGFDVGFYESEWSHYSVILHEVFGFPNPRLNAFARRLNEHLLLGSAADAEALVAEHDLAAKQGEGVEEGDMEPIAVFLPPTTFNLVARGDPQV